MIKLQEIQRKNGKGIYLLYPPRKLVELLGWNKSDELVVRVDREKLIISKE